MKITTSVLAPDEDNHISGVTVNTLKCSMIMTTTPTIILEFVYLDDVF